MEIPRGMHKEHFCLFCSVSGFFFFFMSVLMRVMMEEKKMVGGEEGRSLRMLELPIYSALGG